LLARPLARAPACWPAQANPAGYGTQADIWSLGVIVYILLCGYPPYSLLPNSSFAQEYRTITASPPVFEPDDWGPISREARDFVLRTLCVDPAQRWTADKLLTHPWMTAAAVRDDHLLNAARCDPLRPLH
jgi:serine/threonine protein kinase